MADKLTENISLFIFRHIGGLLLAAMLCAGCSQQRPDQQDKRGSGRKPNIIFILADDLGYGDVRAYNPLSEIPTPNLDRLAHQGMVFTDAHAAGTWCIPSRYGLLTGEYPFALETDWRRQPVIEADQPTLATLLSKRGYRTGMVGKWHLGFTNFYRWNHHGYQGRLHGGPTDRGFDYFYGIAASLDIPPYFYIKNGRAVQPPTDSTAGHHTPRLTPIQGAFWRAGRIAPGFKFSEVLPRLTHQALGFIGRNAGREGPFFLYFALTAPHTPWVPTEQFQGRSGAGMYGDFVMQVDHVVGQIMHKLKQAGIAKNTVLIFSSDNGPVWFHRDVKRTGHRSTAMLRGIKSDSWEGGHRVPFIVRWPGVIEAGSHSDALLSFTDMMATFAAISGEPLTHRGEGRPESFNQLPVWKGKQAAVRRVLPVANSIRKGHWKLIIGSPLGGLHRRFGTVEHLSETKGALYNLKWDPSESKNLYQKYPHKVKQLKKLMQTLKSQGTSPAPQH